MNAEEYYRKKDYPVLDKHDKSIARFDYWDFIDFAEAYHQSKVQSQEDYTCPDCGCLLEEDYNYDLCCSDEDCEYTKPTKIK